MIIRTKNKSILDTSRQRVTDDCCSAPSLQCEPWQPFNHRMSTLNIWCANCKASVLTIYTEVNIALSTQG